MDHTKLHGRSASPAESCFALLDHSAMSIHGDRPQARQKRKRTSPEDQTLLEAAYKRDPKPDKAARLEIVQQVELSEKEVQIWFQNRRQSSRRKSRPLLPHEVAQYHMSRAQAALNISATTRHDTFDSDVPHAEPQHRPYAQLDPDAYRSLTASASVKNQDCRPDELSDSSPAFQCEPNLANAGAKSSLLARKSPHPAEPSIAIIADIDSSRRLRKSTSHIRLSMNAEGKAEITTKDASSPSPPRPLPMPSMPGPAVSLSTTPAPRLSFSTGLQRSFTGRSCDSRSWEFWCDKEARNELETAAERDATGSAAGAIGLLRTASGRNILGAVSSKRSANFTEQADPTKRSKKGHKRTLIQRSNTSLGRLQGRAAKPVPGLPQLKHSGSAARIKGTDSDKENWSPETVASDTFEIGSRRLSAHQSRPRGVLKQDTTSIRPKNPALRGANDGFDNTVDPENDEELAAFMRGGRKSASVSEDDDLDCIQGLLSLSQGNWR